MRIDENASALIRNPDGTLISYGHGVGAFIKTPDGTLYHMVDGIKKEIPESKLPNNIKKIFDEE